MIKEPPSAWTTPQIMIYLFSIIGFFCSTMNGYDGSLINNLLQNPWFKEEYGVSSAGIWAGIVSSMYQIGGVVALPFVSLDMALAESLRLLLIRGLLRSGLLSTPGAAASA